MEICFIGDGQTKFWPTFNYSLNNSTTYDKFYLGNDSIHTQNVTSSFVTNFEYLLFKFLSNLTLLRFGVCFRTELCSVLFVIFFFLQNIITYLQKCKSFWSKRNNFYAININHVSNNKLNSKNNERKKSIIFSENSMTTTKYLTCKKILVAIIVIAQLVEIGFIIVLHINYNDQTIVFWNQYSSIWFCTVRLLASVSIGFCIYHKSYQSNKTYSHVFVSLFWLVSVFNISIDILLSHVYIWNFVPPIPATTLNQTHFSLRHICSNCVWSTFPAGSLYPPTVVRTEISGLSSFNILTENNFTQLNLTYFFNCIYLIIVVCQFVLAFFPDYIFKQNLSDKLKILPTVDSKPFCKPNKLPYNPENDATFFGRLLFTWFSSTIYLGYRRPLNKFDLFPPLEKNCVRNTADIFDRVLQHNQKSIAYRSKVIQPNWLRLLRNRSSVWLILSLLQQFGAKFLKISTIKLGSSLITFLNPVILNRLLGFMTPDNRQPQWHGFFYVASMFLFSFGESVLNSYADYKMTVLAIRIRACLTATIYRRMISNKSVVNSRYTSGQLMNIMSIDTQRVLEYVKIVNIFWICPIQIGISIYMLWQHLGYGSLAGLAVLLLLLPFNTFIGTRLRCLQSQLLEYKDLRLKFLSETLSGIRALKLYAWEDVFIKRINKWRQNEVNNLKTQAIYSAAITFAFTSAPFFVALASFSLYIILYSTHLNPQKVFVSLAIFNIIRRPLAFFPQLVTSSMMFMVSMKRISEYLYESSQTTSEHNEELFPKQTQLNKKSLIKIQCCTFAWPMLPNLGQSGYFRLTEIDIFLQQPSLYAIIGEIGSGKSSFLAAILGQMNQIESKPNTIFEVQGKIAYVPQNAWILSGTVRENILFGLPYDSHRYRRVVDACALKQDFCQLTNGDQTVVGEKGFTLSGGQKQRISIARAVYSDADIYLFDDPLSALDTQIARHVFLQVIGSNGMLANKKRLLTTHNMAILPYVDHIVLLKQGAISIEGSYNDLMRQQNKFTDFLAAYFSENNNGLDDIPNELAPNNYNENLFLEPEEYRVLEDMATRLERQFSTLSLRGSVTRKQIFMRFQRHQSCREISSMSQKIKKNDSTLIDISSQIDFDPIECTSKDSVSFKVYWNYFRIVGWFRIHLVILFYGLGHVFVILTNLWLSFWSSDNVGNQSELSTFQTMMAKFATVFGFSRLQNQWFCLTVYAALGLGQTIFILVATLLLNMSCLRGSQYLHVQMLNRLLFSPLWFFGATTSGQIINRFSKDIDIVDTNLISTLRLLTIEIFRTIASFVAIGFGTNSPHVIAVFVPLIIAYFAIYKYYISTSRHLIRLESALRAPVYSQFNESFCGISIIQAFGAQKHFIDKIYARIDTNNSAYHMSIIAARWLGVRLELLGNLVVLTTTLVCVLMREQISEGMAGLGITCAITVTNTLNLLIRSSTELENNIISVERLTEYTQLPQEAQDNSDSSISYNQSKDGKKSKKYSFGSFWSNVICNSGNNKNPNEVGSTSVFSSLNGANSTWLKTGTITFHQYSARYRNKLDFCLKDINLIIEHGTKVAIVGRTGAGKSSFALSLFRLIESDYGKIFINDRDIKELDIHKLRSQLAIIPQDPLLFTGTLRENLDPMEECTDQQIFDCLEKAHLINLVRSQFANGLNQIIDESIIEAVISSGQKQLLCLARVLLRTPKVLVLDEATASIDPTTEELIQQTIFNHFTDCTVLAIVHRLNSVFNYDRILVLDNGQVQEFGSPTALVANKDSLFSKMLKNQL